MMMVDIPPDLSDNDKNVLLEQWRTCVEMADHISSRRDTMNSLFITINLSLIAAISLSWQGKSIIIAVSGVVLCYLWYHLIEYYRNLNNAKFEVILALEKGLPSQPFSEEWDSFEKKKSQEGTTLEKILPAVFILLHAGLSACIALMAV